MSRFSIEESPADPREAAPEKFTGRAQYPVNRTAASVDDGVVRMRMGCLVGCLALIVVPVTVFEMWLAGIRLEARSVLDKA
jgi:hypothetical protein